MNGHKQVGIIFAGNLYPVAQRDKNIRAAGQMNLVPLFLQNHFQFFGHGQSDIFFINAGIADGSRIFAAVSGVKDDDFLFIDGFGFRIFVTESVFAADLGGKLPFGSYGNINHETPAEIALRRKHKGFLDDCRLLQIEDDTNAVHPDAPQTGFGYQIVFIDIFFDFGTDFDIKGIDNQTFGLIEQKNLIVKLPVRIKDDAPCPMRMDVIPDAAAESAAENAQQKMTAVASTCLTRPFIPTAICCKKVRIRSIHTITQYRLLYINTSYQ